MSVRCIDQVLNRSSHAGTELLMLVVLADYSDDDGNSYPAVASLARKCRMSPRNANYILNALQASGELRVLKNEGPKGTNRYRIMLAVLGLQPLKAASPLKNSSPLKPTSGTPEAGFPKPLKPTSDEPSLNRQEPSAVMTVAKLGAVTEAKYPAGFERLYAAYPKKVAKDEAAKAFAKRRPDEALLELMLAAIERQKRSLLWQKDHGQFIPYPATWLNRGQWQDEVSVGSDVEPEVADIFRRGSA